MDTNWAWIDSLPDALTAQRRLLGRFVEWCEAELAVRWAFLGCSLARGAGDSLSDLDLSIGVTTGMLARVEPRLVAVLGTLSSLVESYVQDWPATVPVRRYFVQYADRSQIDLTVSEAREATHLVDGVVLYDPDGLVQVVTAEVLAPTPDEVRIWACSAWEALLNLVKYLRRASLWEARQQLEDARRRLFQLWALAEDVPQARYGITALCDTDPPPLPPLIERSLSVADAAAMAAAARSVAGALLQAQQRLEERGTFELPDALARFAVADLWRATPFEAQPPH